MTIDPTAIPTSIDMLHLILLATTALFFILFLAKKGPQAAPEQQPAQQPVEKAATAAVEPAAAKPKSSIVDSSPVSALQLLSLLQQEARFIDFVKEDLGGFSDADIGAAARVVHEGSQKTLNDYFTLTPLRPEDEDSRITLAAGFNATEVRLTGNVVGEAPFSGTLIHRGWKAEQVRLPKLSPGHDANIISPAEVEL